MKVEEMETEEVVRKQAEVVKELLDRLNSLREDIYCLDVLAQSHHHEFNFSLESLDQAISQLRNYHGALAKRLGEILLA